MRSGDGRFFFPSSSKDAAIKIGGSGDAQERWGPDRVVAGLRNLCARCIWARASAVPCLEVTSTPKSWHETLDRKSIV